jgi:hypothetical protein
MQEAKLPDNLHQIRTKQLFDLHISPDFIENHFLKGTNLQAAAKGAGGSAYQDFIPLEVYR